MRPSISLTPPVPAPRKYQKLGVAVTKHQKNRGQG